MQEIEIHLKAFETFFECGGAASQANYERVATVHHVDKRTIERWSRAFKWKTRALERTAQFRTDLEEHTTEKLLSTNDRYRGIIEKMIDRFENNLAADIVSVKTVDQFETLVKLDQALSGQAVGSQPITINIISAVPRPGDVRKAEPIPVLDMIAVTCKEDIDSTPLYQSESQEPDVNTAIAKSSSEP